MTPPTPGRFRRSTVDWRRVGSLLVPLVVASLVAVAYGLTHSHPAYGGGLYLQIAREIQVHGYHLPARIPYYTEGGVPFAYPPLAFYAIAAVVDLTGVDPVQLMLVVPGVLTVLYLVPFYALARRLLDSDLQAGLATLLFAVTPVVLRWHLSAGGLVRASAMLLTLLGLVVGVELFRTGERRWLVPAALLWGLTLLTHPVYAVFFGWSYLLLFAAFDRTPAGLVNGVVVFVGGLLLASPWWLTVVSTHGPSIFLHASDSRTSLGGGGWRLVTQFVFPITVANATTPFYLGAYVGSIYAVYRGRYLLPAWTISAAYLLGTPRFTFVAGSMVAALLVVEVVAPALADLGVGLAAGDVIQPEVIRSGFVGRTGDHQDEDDDRRSAPGATALRRTLTVLVLLLVVVGVSGVGVAYAASDLHEARLGSPSQPQTVYPTDRAAMAWARSHTGSNATFFVVGDEAEWFPYYSHRTILVGPWGTEWTNPHRFQTELTRYHRLSNCHSASCIDGLAADVDRSPDYVYVPTRPYTVDGARHSRPYRLISSLYRSDRYRLRYNGEGVLIFERTGPTDHHRAGEGRRAAADGSHRSGGQASAVPATPSVRASP